MTIRVSACVMPKCPRTAYRKGYCRSHHDGFLRTGDWPYPTCPVCTIPMREDAPACGFCVAEQLGGVAA